MQQQQAMASLLDESLFSCTKLQQQQQEKNNNNKPATAATSEQLPLKCPRCYSTSTKFCYYNNYSLSQPRYFCKSCRRYWTQGGSLRNVPVGGGTRKTKKTSSSSIATAAPAKINSQLDHHQLDSTSSPVLPPLTTFDPNDHIVAFSVQNHDNFMIRDNLDVLRNSEIGASDSMQSLYGDTFGNSDCKSSGIEEASGDMDLGRDNWNSNGIGFNYWHNGLYINSSLM